MPNTVKNERRLSLGAISVLFVPIAALVAGYAFLNHLQLGIADNYDRYREFWGGNPSEVFSHWLDMVLMSGGAVVIAWSSGAEAFLRRSENTLMRRLNHACVISCLILSGVTAVVLDGLHGEGTVMLAYSVFFIPILASSCYLLRQFAALMRWSATRVILLSLGFAALHTLAQLYYEPSGTGGPNRLIVPLWLASVVVAIVWAFVRSIHTGFLGRLVVRSIRTVRKPIVWGSTLLILFAIGIPITLHAQRARKAHQEMAFAWLDELDTKLTDDFIAEIKHSHTPASADGNSRIPVSPAAHSLLVDARIKGDNALRIYVPLNQDDYIFLWGNDRFEYCDIRRLVREHTEEIDQGFIDSLIASGGTHQTRLYSVLWSPYMAGRVFKDKAGGVKAICVINAP